MKYLTTTQAAARLKVNQSRIRQLILAGRLRATKVGRDWMLLEKDINHFDANERMPPGNPDFVKHS